MCVYVCVIYIKYIAHTHTSVHTVYPIPLQCEATLYLLTSLLCISSGARLVLLAILVDFHFDPYQRNYITMFQQDTKKKHTGERKIQPALFNSFFLFYLGRCFIKR